jgi:predicted lipoprotein
MKKSVIWAVIVGCIVIACQNDNSSGNGSTDDDFYQRYFDQKVSAALTAFKSDSEKGVELAIAFRANPSQDKFNALQVHWKVWGSSFSRLDVYSFFEVKERFFNVNLQNFPVNTAFIESNIDDGGVYDTAYLNTKSTVTKGLATVEYLLYHERNSEEAFELLSEDTFRVDYLVAISEEILRQTNLLLEFWETYESEFVNSKGNSCADMARCIAFNQLINIIDVAKVTKVGKPAGLEKSSNISLDKLEAFRSGASLGLIKACLQEVEKAYSQGDSGFSIMVNDIAGSSELSNNIAAAFAKLYQDIDAMPDGLYVAISNGDPMVLTFYDDLTQLIKYFSVDAASILSVTVVPTDNDGD